MVLLQESIFLLPERKDAPAAQLKHLRVDLLKATGSNAQTLGENANNPPYREMVDLTDLNQLQQYPQTRCLVVPRETLWSASGGNEANSHSYELVEQAHFLGDDQLSEFE